MKTYFIRTLIFAAVYALTAEAFIALVGQVPYNWLVVLWLFAGFFIICVGVDAAKHRKLLRANRCRLFHHKHVEQYWTEFTKYFWRCNKCGHHWSEARKWESS